MKKKQHINFIEKQFQSIVKSNDLIEIRLFQVNDNYFGFPKQKRWIIDGGIELKFKNTTFSLAWNPDEASFTFENKRFEEIYNKDNFTELKADFIKSLNQKKVTKAKLKWLEYDVILDYTMSTKKESKLVELIMEFESNERIQIATVFYKIGEKNSIENYSYDISEELLIVLDTEIETIINNN